jgi:hypothetical protein
MSIEIVYQVINERSGEVIGVYTDKKIANIVDQRTDALYEVSDLLEKSGSLSDEKLRDTIAEFILNNRKELFDVLKSVKDIPVEGEEEAAPLLTPYEPKTDDDVSQEDAA